MGNLGDRQHMELVGGRNLLKTKKIPTEHRETNQRAKTAFPPHSMLGKWGCTFYELDRPY
jgi:hypothetical protein